MKTDLEGVEITLVECFRKVVQGANDMSHLTPDGDIVKCSRVGSVVFVEVKLH